MEKMIDILITPFKEWLKRKITELSKKVDIDYEHILGIGFVVLVCVSLVYLPFQLDSPSFSVQIFQSKTLDDGNIQSVLKYSWDLYELLKILLVLSVLSFGLGYLLIKLEKKHNELISEKKINELRNALQTTNRSSIAQYSSFSSQLISHVDNTRFFMTEDEWRAPMRKNEKKQKRQAMIQHYLTAFDEYCRRMMTYIAPYIHTKNPDDTINISIKLFFDGPHGEKKVICMGKCVSSTNEIGPGQSSTAQNPTPNWDSMLQNSYRLDEDYAMSLVSKPDHCKTIFCCGDISALICRLTELRTTGATGLYRIPESVRQNRQFQATLVCPILIYDGNAQAYIVLGAICIDTTNTYLEWEASGSYEENVVSVAAAYLAPLIEHSMKELKWANQAISRF